MKISRCARIGALAVLATLVLPGTGWAFVPTTLVGPLDFCPPVEYDVNFVEVRRNSDISPGGDHCAVNFIGLTGSAGDTWLTRYNTASDTFNAFNGICMSADVLINKSNNAKGGGLVALLNTDTGAKGLFLLLINNGNTDRLTLNTIDPNDGKIAQLASVPLSSAIAENIWYRMEMTLLAQAPSDLLGVTGRVLSHTDQSNPSDATVDGQIGSALIFNGSLQDQGLEQSGYVGMAAWAKSAVVNTRITNFFATAPCSD
jgi:hypothetical protein